MSDIHYGTTMSLEKNLIARWANGYGSLVARARTNYVILELETESLSFCQLSSVIC